VVFSDHPALVGDVVFCPDGRTLLVRAQRPIWIWDTVTGQLAKQDFPGLSPNSPTITLAISPDGKRAAVCIDGWVRSWSPVDGSEGPTLPSRLNIDGPGIALAFCPDGALLAVAGTVQGDSAGQLTLHYSTTGRALRTFPLGSQGWDCAAHGLAFSPDGRTLALGWGRPLVRLWDVARGQEWPPLAGDAARVTAVAYSPDGKTLAAAIDRWGDDTLQLWDVATRREKAAWTGRVSDLAFSPDSRLLVTVGRDGCLRLGDTADGRLRETFRWHQSEITTVAFSPDGRWLATGGNENRVKLWPVDALSSLAKDRGRDKFPR
jgi:WD40 repeat protein